MCSDSPSGGRIQNDIKTFSSLVVYGLCVVTEVTSQNNKDFNYTRSSYWITTGGTLLQTNELYDLKNFKKGFDIRKALVFQ